MEQIKTGNPNYIIYKQINNNFEELDKNRIKQLVGTQENPINLYTDTEIGQLYSLGGYLLVDENRILNISNYLTPDNHCLFFRQGDTHGITMGLAIYLTNNIIMIDGVRGVGGSTFTINNLGYITLPNVFNTPYINETGKVQNLIYAPTTSGVSGQILQSKGKNTAPIWIDMPSTAPTLEEQTIESASWTSLSGQTPYTYSATVTATTTIGTDSIVELINNQAVLFATYGFAIGSISGQNITIYSIGQPSTSITLTMGVTS